MSALTPIRPALSSFHFLLDSDLTFISHLVSKHKKRLESTVVHSTGGLVFPHIFHLYYDYFLRGTGLFPLNSIQHFVDSGKEGENKNFYLD